MTFSKRLPLIYKFYIYQGKRFPIIFLILSIFPVILSSAVIVMQGKPNLLQLLLAFVASLSYFFHIRVIDDYRDFQHDNLYHKDRPVQAGIISLADLKKIDFIMVAIFLLISIFSNLYSFGLALFLLLYTYFAKNDFFAGEKIRKYFYSYNTINFVQMIILQMYIYAFFSKGFYFNSLINTHFLFIITGTLIFEFLRKVKTPESEGAGKDTYSWHMGFGRSIMVYLLFVFLNAFLFFKIAASISSRLEMLLLVSLSFIMITSLFAYLNWIKRNDTTTQLLQLISLISYGSFNIIIYLLK